MIAIHILALMIGALPVYFTATGKPYGEWICGKHWSLLTKDERRVWRRHKRQERRFGSPLRPDAYDRIWKALKRRADPRTP